MNKQTVISNLQISEYINSKRMAWASTTCRAEHARLRAVAPLLTGDAGYLYAEGIKLYAPYTLKQVFTSVGGLFAFLYPSEVNPYKAFLVSHANLFKNVYVTEIVTVSFEEAVEAIKLIADSEIRQLANYILFTGLRAEEALQYTGGGEVLGKGAKKRKVIEVGAAYPSGHKVTYSRLHKALSAVGLKPHTLRKLYATKLANANLTASDLMAIMGWSNMQTASRYLQPMRDEQLKLQLKGIFNAGI